LILAGGRGRTGRAIHFGKRSGTKLIKIPRAARVDDSSTAPLFSKAGLLARAMRDVSVRSLGFG
jgi:hypothetical protein